jgi:tape measure domain-containing protein
VALGNREVGIELRARDMASSALQSVGSGLGSVGAAAETTSGKVGMLGKVLGPVAQGMQLAFGFSVAGKIAQGLGMVKDAAIGFNAKLEQWRIAFKQTLGSAEAADEFIRNMKEFAAKTPFEMPGLVDAAQKLTGAGMAAKHVIPTLTALGDAIAGAGKGQEYVISATNALTKMMRAGRVTGESMMYLSEAGVNAWKYLADGLGKSIPETQKLVTKGQVDANTALKAIRDGVAESDLGGMMDVQSRTFNGAVSTINDQLRNVMSEAFQPFFDLLRDITLKVGEFLQSSAWTDWGPRVAGAIKKVTDALRDPIGSFKKLADRLKDVGGPLTLIRDAMREIRELGIAKMAEAFGALADKIKSVADIAPDLSTVTGPLYTGLVLLAGAFNNVSSGGTTFAENSELVRAGFYNLQEGLKAISVKVLEGIGGLFRTLAVDVWSMTGSLQALEPIITPFGAVLWDIADAFIALSKGDVAGALVDVAEGFSGIPAVIDGAYTALDQWLQQIGPGMEAAVAGFMSWVETGLPKLLDAALPAIEGLLSKLFGMSPKIGEIVLGWAEKLVDWIAPAIPKVLEQLSVFGQKLFAWVIQMAPQWLNELLALGTGLVDFIVDRIPDAIAAIGQWAQSLFDWIVNTGVPTLASSLGPMALALVDWIFETLPKLLDALDDIIGAIINFIVTNGPVLIGKLIEWAIAFVGWIATEVIPRLIENLPTILRTILLFLGGALGKIVGKAGEIGLGLVSKLIGFVKTLPGKVGGFIGQLPGKIGSFLGDIVSKGGEIGGKFINAMLDFFGKLPGRVGEFLLNVILTVGKWGLDLHRKAISIAGGFIKGVVDTLKSLPGRVWDVITGLIGSLFRTGFSIGPLRVSTAGIFLAGAQVASFDVGSWKVPKDMPAIVHEGEMIIPTSIAQAIRDMASRGSTQQGAPFPRMAVQPGVARGGQAIGGGSLTIINNFGKDSIRSDNDISRISKEMAVQARMQGLTPTLRAVGSGT